MVNKFYILLFVIVYSSPTFSQTTNPQKSSQVVAWNGKIDSSSRREISILNHQLFSSFCNSDEQKLISLFSDRLYKKMGDKTREFLDQVHALIRTNSYTLFDEYLIKNSVIGANSGISKSNVGDDAYKINFIPNANETYISLLTFKGWQFNDWLITARYGKYNGKWELDGFWVGQFKLADKNAIDLYKQALKDYRANNMIGVVNNLLTSKMVQDPSQDNFVYFKRFEIENFRNKIQKEFIEKLVFPMQIKGVKTSPQIFGVQPIVKSEGIFPSVNYITKIDLKNFALLTAENEEIRTKINNIFPRITKGKKYVFFKAYNQTEDGRRSAEHFDFVWQVLK